jgi:hypothetical protein
MQRPSMLFQVVRRRCARQLAPASQHAAEFAELGDAQK